MTSPDKKFFKTQFISHDAEHVSNHNPGSIYTCKYIRKQVVFFPRLALTTYFSTNTTYRTAAFNGRIARMQSDLLLHLLRGCNHYFCTFLIYFALSKFILSSFEGNNYLHCQNSYMQNVTVVVYSEMVRVLEIYIFWHLKNTLRFYQDCICR